MCFGYYNPLIYAQFLVDWFEPMCDILRMCCCGVYIDYNGRAVFSDESCDYIPEFYILTDRQIFSEAEADCELLSIHNDATNEAVMAAIEAAGEVNAWIGLSDREKETVFKYTDKTPLDYTSWNSGQPDDANAGEDCVVVFRKDGNVVWNDQVMKCRICELSTYEFWYFFCVAM